MTGSWSSFRTGWDLFPKCFYTLEPPGLVYFDAQCCLWVHFQFNWPSQICYVLKWFLLISYCQKHFSDFMSRVTCRKMNIFLIPSASIILLEKSPRLYWKEHTAELMVKRPKTDKVNFKLIPKNVCCWQHTNLPTPEACFSAVEIRAKVLAHSL